MRVVVFGASGDQGAAQVRALARAGHHPVAVSRKAMPLSVDEKNIETRAADFADQGSLKQAIRETDAVFLNLPSTSFQAAAPLIEAAGAIASFAKAEPSVRHIIFNTSLPISEVTRGFAAQDARLEMRRRIFASGVASISIQPVVFLDNLLKGWAWPSIARQQTLIYPHKETLDVSWICHDDLAALMIAALERPHLAGRIFPVGGPETVRLPMLAKALSRAWGQELSWKSQSIDAFAERMKKVFEGKATLESEKLISELHRVYTWYNSSPEHPFQVDMQPVLRELPVTLTPIESWARRQLLPEKIGFSKADGDSRA